MSSPLLALSPGDPTPRWFSRALARERGLRRGRFAAQIRSLKRHLAKRRQKRAPITRHEPALALPYAPRSAPIGLHDTAPPRPTDPHETGVSTGYDLALVLSGGGARGFAHVGVLQVVEELQIRVDLVVGVSMGSIIGAGYAAGLTAEEMADLARALRISTVFRPRPGRLNLVDPAGIRAVLSGIFGERRFEDLDRELVVVSSSLTTGQHFVIRDGSLVDAIVASCSIPLVFPPVTRDGHHLLDGGLIDGFPITLVRGLGARRILAVDASTHARHVLRLPGVRHATRGVVRILDRRSPRPAPDAVRIFSRVLHHATLAPARPPVEVLIRPTFGRRSTLHYHRWSDMVACGRAAAEAARPALAALAALATAADENA